MFINADVDNGDQEEKVEFKVVWKKNTYDVAFPLDERVDKLKEHINTLCGWWYLLSSFADGIKFLLHIGIPPAMMKLMYKGW